MHPIIRNILAVLAGIIGGSAVNMAIIFISGSIIPPPAGADLNTTEGLEASMHLMEPQHFLMPFLAHALGTLVGAFLAARIASTHKLIFALANDSQQPYNVVFSASFKMIFALAMGVLFLAGGIGAVIMLPSPLWFNVVDLVGAYIPMAYLGGRLAINASRP